jgi:hypothetical protein
MMHSSIRRAVIRDGALLVCGSSLLLWALFQMQLNASYIGVLFLLGFFCIVFSALLRSMQVFVVVAFAIFSSCMYIGTKVFLLSQGTVLFLVIAIMLIELGIMGLMATLFGRRNLEVTGPS